MESFSYVWIISVTRSVHILERDIGVLIVQTVIMIIIIMGIELEVVLLIISVSRRTQQVTQVGFYDAICGFASILRLRDAIARMQCNNSK